MVEEEKKEEKKPSDYLAKDGCEAAGFHWYEGTCHASPKEKEKTE